jgi:hypothetical protein
MEYVGDRELAIRYARRFGHIAINMGFVNIEQVSEALTEQITSDSFTRLRPCKLIGEILFENGWITLKQIEKVVEEISKKSNIL